MPKANNHIELIIRVGKGSLIFHATLAAHSQIKAGSTDE